MVAMTVMFMSLAREAWDLAVAVLGAALRVLRLLESEKPASSML